MAGSGDLPGDSGDSGEPGAAEEEARRAVRAAAARERFAALARRPDREIDLAEGALLIAAEEYPDLDIPAYLARLDALADRVRRRITTGAAGSPPAPDADEAALAALHGVLFEEEGFHGAEQEEFADPRNSFLNDVLDRKRGLPITLSVVYCEVARRAGLDAVGINLPGRFIAQFRGVQWSTLVDPYDGGTRLQPDDCVEIVRRIYGEPVHLTAEHFLPAPRKRILARILTNLKGFYFQRRQYVKALAAVERILAINPTLDQVRDRGIILRELATLALRDLRQRSLDDPMRLSDLQQAASLMSAAWFDLKLYARLAEDQPDRAAVQTAADQLWRDLGRQN